MDMKRLLFSLVLFFSCSLGVTAQNTPWKMDFYLGTTAYVGDLADHPFYSQNWKPAVGIGLQYQLSTPFSIKTDLYHGRLSGNDQFFDTPDWPSGDRRAKFTSSFTQWNLSLEYHFLESPRLGHLRKISPYLAFGGGLLFYEPSPNYGFTRNPELEEALNYDIEAEYANVAWNADLALGLDWRISDQWTIGINLSIHPTSTDYIDGVSRSGNPESKDWLTKSGLRLQYRFASEPDLDRDGIADKNDHCPEIAGLPEMQGCPDSDRDGLHDGRDLCPLDPGTINLRGCPDRDGDGIADKDDLCPDVPGPVQRGGCAIEDRDGDGIEDRIDLCPDEAGPPEREGCPIVDSDQDGILDEDDRCPNEFGLPIFTGCPDTDGDGIENSRDACPTLFGVYTNNGCPEMILPEEAAAEINRQILLFDSGSADIPRYRLLDQIIEFLKENPSYSLTITGFTDSEGRPEDHQRLSRARARSCYRYLTQQGIDDARMKYQGLGQRDPEFEKLYAKGQAFNRRVEFLIYK